MRKRFAVVLILFVFSFLNSFSKVYDKIGFFNEEEEKQLEEKMVEMKKDFGINYEVYTLIENDISIENSLKNSKKSVIIIMQKDEEEKLVINLKVTLDIELMGYRDSIDEFLEKTSYLIDNGDYTDYIFELMGNIADITTLIEVENSRVRKEEFEKKAKVITVSLAVSVLFVLILFYISRFNAHRIFKCRNCNIDMELIDEFQEGKYYSKIYNCKICGYSKKITSSRH